MRQIYIKPLGRIAFIADMLMLPIMYLVSGTLREIPQRTHRWNNSKFTDEQVADFDRMDMVHCSGISTAMQRINPIYHIQILGGWRDYAVLIPTDTNRSWHIGWVTHDVIGATRITLKGPARALIGPGDVSFFGIDAITGEQIPIRQLARGRVGEGGPYAKTPLL